MKNRTISNTILKKRSSHFGRIIVITGARQAGKTTLVKKIFPDHQYISIEDPLVVEEYKRLTASQWSTFYPKAILDEIQKEPQLVESIKSVYDQFTEIVDMYPLTLPELMTNNWEDEVQLSYFQNIILNKPKENKPFLLDSEHPKKKMVLDTYLNFGGYPAISDSTISDEDKQIWLRNYVRTYLERDIRDLAELRRLEPFTKVQKLLALNTAQLTNYSQIAVEAGVSSKTVQRFLEYMSISYQTLVLQPWCRNPKKRLVKSPKVHYLDVGVMRAILQKKDELNGNEFESAIVAEIFKQVKSIDAMVSFYHLRTLDGREIDLLIETEHGYIAIEIKKSETVRSVDAKHLKGLDDILDKPILHRFVISNDLSTKDFEDGILALSAVQFLT